jgi:hypothetical protein
VVQHRLLFAHQQSKQDNKKVSRFLLFTSRMKLEMFQKFRPNYSLPRNQTTGNLFDTIISDITCLVCNALIDQKRSKNQRWAQDSYDLRSVSCSTAPTSSMKLCSAPPPNPGLQTMVRDSYVWFTVLQFLRPSGFPEKQKKYAIFKKKCSKPNLRFEL